jgi:alpha-glucuronidase
VLSTTPLRLLIGALLAVSASAACAEDGYDLWLRYRLVEAEWRGAYSARATSVVETVRSPTLDAAANELRRGIAGMLGSEPGAKLGEGAIVLARSSRGGDEGYCIESRRTGGHAVTMISARSDTGALYGAFALLRLMQTRALPVHLHICDTPAVALRMLDHWDNLDGTIERGYAGPSLWNWAQLPAIDPRLIDYARADASVGINGVVLNNVNADARILTPDYLRKVAAIADAWRPYGIRVYLSARFSAPMELGHLPTADPLDPRVRSWWRAKADEIYRRIPDFGGLLVKANSEGQPGPQSYGRSHADGANMLADALAPHHGTVIWRAFVYSGATQEDRAKQAFDEFRPLDGKFRPNVVLQVKNGPIDFQPREPFHPLFGAMPRTRLAMEVQLTKEYLGENTNLAYLGTMWSEVLRSRTARPRRTSRVLDSLSAMAGVANVGGDRDWTGSEFDQANWYAFGRLAWDPAADPETIAAEWTRMTWGNGPKLVRPIVAMMMRSRQAVVDAMTPLGLAHQMASDHHYGPGPWVSDQPAPLWNPTYYNRADATGIGFDRTAAGSNAVAQYAPRIGRCFADLGCVPDDYLLWFHHLPWTYRMRSGESLWEALVRRYDRGVAQVRAMNRTWASLAPMVDMPRHLETAAKLQRQLLEAQWWRDASIAYFQSVSRLPLPAETRPPDHGLAWYKAIHFDTVPGFLAPGTGRQLSCVPPTGGPPCAL